MLKFIKRSITSVLLAGTIMYGAIIAPEAHNHYLRWEVGESVVQVLSMTSDGGGTGFAVKAASGREFIMTNRHVCEAGMNGKIRVKVPGERPVVKYIFYVDKVHDLCLIQGIKGLSPLSIGSDLDKGDHLYVVGHPGLRALTVSQGEYIGKKTIELQFEAKTRKECPGRIVEIPPGLFQFLYGMEFICVRKYDSLATSAVIYGGNSGSPVVNKWGNLIGVAFAGSPEQERDNYLVPLRYVKAVLNKF